jgi:uncharacterized membrane protein YphA (DoxX/SURF4 family)
VAAPTIGTLLLDGVAIVSGGAVVVGVLTPASAVVVAMTLLLFWLPFPVKGLFLDRLSTMLLIAEAAAIALLGSGALSVDARLFGRREILIPHDSHPPPV